MTIAANISATEARPSGREANRRGEEDFRHARRHSLIVRIMKMVLPTIAVLCMLSFVALAAISYVPISNFSISGASLKDGRLTMETPKMAGFDSKGRPYDVRARRAMQDISKPKIIELVRIDADLPMDQKSTAKLTAEEGTYDSEAETLQLRNNIEIRGARGMDIDLHSADIDIRSGKLVSTKPVKVVSDTSAITAQRVEVENSGKRIVFRDKVRVIITRPVERGTSQAEQQTKDASQ